MTSLQTRHLHLHTLSFHRIDHLLLALWRDCGVLLADDVGGRDFAPGGSFGGVHRVFDGEEGQVVEGALEGLGGHVVVEVVGGVECFQEAWVLIRHV